MLNVKTVGGKLDITLSDAKSFKPIGKPKVQHGGGAGMPMHRNRHTKSRSLKQQQLKPKAVSETLRSSGKLSQKDLHGRGKIYPEKKSDLKTKFSGDGKGTRSLNAFGAELQLEAEGYNDIHKRSPQEHAVLGSKLKQELEEQVSTNSGWNTKPKMPAKPERNSHKEVADIEEYMEYNPWGRPGAGAPLRTSAGNVIADFREMNQGSADRADVREGFRSAARNPTGHHQQTRLSPGPVAAAPPRTTTNHMETAVPLALRSSFAAGAPGLVTRETQNKSENMKKWREELDMQIKEKKERKLRDEHASEVGVPYSWGGRGESNRSPPRPVPSEVALETAALATPSPMPALQMDHHSQSLPGDHSSTHARGFGMRSLNLQSPDDMEKKRVKMLEHQRAIQEQVEEKRRKKREELDEKKRVEAAAEAKLAQQRLIIQQQFEEDQRRKKEKEEESRQRSEAMRLSVLKAYEAAQQAKIDKRHKHRRAVEEISVPKSSLEEVPRPSPLSATRDDTPHDGQSLASPTLTPTVDSSSSPAWGGGVRTSYDDQSSYKVDAEISETEGRQSVSSAGPVHNDNNKTGLKKKSSTTSSHSALRGAKSNVVGSRSEGRMPRKAGPPQVRNGKGADAMSPRKQKAVAGRTSDYPSPPHSPLLDAFMVPYRRTTSATLPQQQDPPTSHLGASQFDHAKPGSGLHVRANQPHPTGLVPMYRSGSLNLEDGQGSEHSSKQRKPAPSTSTARKKQGKFVSGGVKRSPTAEAGPSLPQRASNKETKRTIDVVPTGAMTKEVEEARPTSRQEMIIQQLATLRQGLLIKERELHGVVL